jgi:exodeoxyribonuclease VII small subunit
MAKKKASQSPTNSVSFEMALEKLRSVVHELEEGNLSLTDSLDKYESGVSSLKHCYAALKSAENRIERLVRLDDSGNLITEPFEAAATQQTSRQTTRASKGAKPSPTANRNSGPNASPKGPAFTDEVDDDDWEDEDMDEPDGLF